MLFVDVFHKIPFADFLNQDNFLKQQKYSNARMMNSTDNNNELFLVSNQIDLSAQGLQPHYLPSIAEEEGANSDSSETQYPEGFYEGRDRKRY